MAALIEFKHLLLRRWPSVSWPQTWPLWQAGHTARTFSPSSAHTATQTGKSTLQTIKKKAWMNQIWSDCVCVCVRGMWNGLIVTCDSWFHTTECRCRGWPPSTAQWGAGPRSSPGLTGPSASAWCPTAEAVMEISRERDINQHPSNQVTNRPLSTTADALCPFSSQQPVLDIQSVRPGLQCTYL